MAQRIYASDSNFNLTMMERRQRLKGRSFPPFAAPLFPSLSVDFCFVSKYTVSEKKISDSQDLILRIGFFFLNLKTRSWESGFFSWISRFDLENQFFFSLTSRFNLENKIFFLEPQEALEMKHVNEYLTRKLNLDKKELVKNKAEIVRVWEQHFQETKSLQWDVCINIWTKSFVY